MAYFMGILAAACYGMVALFSLPMLRDGMNPYAMIFYRMTASAILMGLFAASQRLSFRCTRKEFLRVSLFAFLYTGSSVINLLALQYIPSSLMSLIVYTNPVFVVVFMLVFWHEIPSLQVVCAVVAAVTGVILLRGGTAMGADLSMLGLALALTATLFKTAQFVTVRYWNVPSMPRLVMTFYMLAAGSVFSLITCLLATGEVSSVPHPRDWALLIGLAFVCTVIANGAIFYAMPRLGSTITSILGVSEPFTGVIIGVLVFGDSFTAAGMAGMALVIASTVTIILRRKAPKGT